MSGRPRATPLSRPLLSRWLPPRAADAHKGSFGHVLVVAGSRGMSGAAALASRAALRAGAGLVTAAVPASIQGVVASLVPEALTLGLPETGSGALTPEAAGRLRSEHRARAYTVLALGPGLSAHPETARAVVAILGSIALPAVIDADGLNVLAGQPRPSVRQLLLRRGMPCVLTPHPGELARLLRRGAAPILAKRQASAEELSGELACVCVLKGRGTVVTDGKRTFVNPTGNPGLAKGGSGDALTGVIAALWAQRLEPRGPDADRGLEAAALGAWLHGAAADAAARDKTAYCLLASDVIEALPRAFRRLS